MGYRRLFIMRKDLNMSPGKLAAQVAHCAEAYWTHKLRGNIANVYTDGSCACITRLTVKEFNEYVCGTFTKTICQARNKNHLLKAKEMALSLGLNENEHFGLIYDKCLTELIPEEPDGTTLTGIWFCPLEDSVAHSISKKYHLYT